MKNIPSPCFVIEEEKLLKNLELIKKVQDETGVFIIQALKAFAGYPLFPIFKKYCAGATASSVSESRIIFQEYEEKAHVFAAAITDEDIVHYNKYASHLVFNTWNQFHRHQANINSEISIGIRVNPGYSEVKTDLYNPTLPLGRLGVREEEMPKSLPENVEGLHFHALCENDSYTLENVLLHFEEKYAHFFPKLKWVNFGGGHLMTAAFYEPEHLVQVLKAFKNRYPHLKVYMEPGSAFMWQTGFLKATIEDIIPREEFDIAMLNVSFTGHMPDCLEMPYKPAVKKEVIAEIQPRETILGGNSCLSGDYIRGFYFETKKEIGEDLIFEDMIHYTMVKTTTFNGVNHPAIGLLKTTGEFQLWKSYHPQDYFVRNA